MVGHGLSLFFAVFLWWLSTGVILMLCSLPKKTFGWSLGGFSLMLTLALYGLTESARTSSTIGTYLSFISAIGIWAWLEMSFLMGYITGPRTTACPPDARGWSRFRLALETLLYHELSIVAAGFLVVYLTWGAPNQTGTVAFLILMAMRISAKLNIFLGVPYLPDALLPDRLGYLKSYFRIRKFNPLFPISIFGACWAALALGERALANDGAIAVGWAMSFTLLSLAIIEHFFMMLPIPDRALWRWAKPFDPTDPAGRSSS